MRLRVLRECEEVVGVTPPHLLRVAQAVELLPRVLANCLEQREAWLFVAADDAYEVCVDELRESVDDVSLVAADSLGCFERAPAGKHG